MSDALLVSDPDALAAHCETGSGGDTHMNKILAFILVAGVAFIAELTPQLISGTTAQSITIA